MITMALPGGKPVDAGSRLQKAACRAPCAAPGKRPMGGFSVGWAGGEGHRGGVGLAGLVRPADADLVAGVVLPQHRLDVRGGRDGVPGDRRDRVARGQPCLVSRRSGHDAGDGKAADAGRAAASRAAVGRAPAEAAIAAEAGEVTEAAGEPAAAAADVAPEAAVTAAATKTGETAEAAVTAAATKTGETAEAAAATEAGKAAEAAGASGARG